MTTADDRRRLRDAYDARPPDAGVYAIRNRATGRALVGASRNLAATRNRFEFGRSMEHPGALDPRVASEVREHGYDALEFEVVDRLEVTPGMTDAELARALETLEALWREQLGDTGR